MDITFATVFRNFEGKEVASTWLDPECGQWAISTVPLQRFPTELAAINFYRRRCDSETGLLLSMLGIGKDQQQRSQN